MPVSKSTPPNLGSLWVDGDLSVSSVAVSAFEILLVGETEADLVAVAAGALADPGDSRAEAGHAAALHAEVSRGTVALRKQENKRVSKKKMLQSCTEHDRVKPSVITGVWIRREGQHSVRDAEHQAFGVDGLTGVRPLVRLLHIADGESTTAVLAAHGDSVNRHDMKPPRSQVRT